MNDESSDDDRYSMAAISEIFTEAMEPFADEHLRIYETNSPKWVAEVERTLASRNEKDAAAAFRGFLHADPGMENMRETLVRYSLRHKVKLSRPADLLVLLDELRAVSTMISGLRRRAILPLMEHSGVRLKVPDREGTTTFGLGVYAAIHYATLESEFALKSMQEFTSTLMQAVGPDRGGRSSPLAKEFSVPLEWLARTVADVWLDAGRNFRKHDAAMYLQILRAIHEVITDDEDLPRGGKDLLAVARKVVADR